MLLRPSDLRHFGPHGGKPLVARAIGAMERPRRDGGADDAAAATNQAADAAAALRHMPYNDEELEMIVILRMNREFMQFMRKHYPNVAKETFGKTVIES